MVARIKVFIDNPVYKKPLKLILVNKFITGEKMELTGVFFNLILMIVFLTLLFVVLSSVYYAMKGRNTVMTASAPAPAVQKITVNNASQNRTQVSFEELDSRILDYNFDNLRSFERTTVPARSTYNQTEIFKHTMTERTAAPGFKMNGQFR